VRAFPPTHRSVFDRIRSGDTEIRRAAFGALADGYWRPSYHYLRLRWHLPAEDAEDAVQAFFAAAFEKRYVEKFDPAKARFRTFLRTCLDRFVQNDRKAETAEKRGGSTPRLSLDCPGAERDLAAHLVAPTTDPDAFFRDETIRALCARTVDAMREEFVAAGRTRAFDVFTRHDLAEDAAHSYASVADSLGLTVAQVTNDLHLARRRFREIVLVELRVLVGTDEEFLSEARDLFGFEVSD
jgi:DNA-directed RNA polymerase specialized sigma24 family protein